MAEPLVYTLIINWNGRDHLEACFQSLLACPYPNARYILLDNASTDDSVGFVRGAFGADPRVEIVQLSENLGWSRGNNVGLQKALDDGADYVFLLNNDTWTAPDALPRLVARAETDRQVAAVCPKMLIFDNPEIINSLGLVCSIIGNAWDLGIGRLDQSKWNVPREVIGFCGGAALLRVEALRHTGLLPTNFDIYLDDLDLSLRFWNRGYTIWNCPEAVVHHKYSATMGHGEQRRRKYFLNTRNRLRVVARNFPGTRWRQIVPAMLRGEVKAIGRSLLDREPWRAVAHAQAWIENVQDLPEIRQIRKLLEEPARYWRLIEMEQLFFPGTEFPVDGWYRPVAHDKRTVRPMSTHAQLSVQAERMRILHVNPYPHLGPTSIEVLQHGKTLAVLSTTGVDEVTLDTAPGLVEFRTGRIFDADDTGARIDIGGWLRVEAVDDVCSTVRQGGGS